MPLRSVRVVWPVAVALTVAAPSVALMDTVGKLGASRFADREAAARSLRAAGQPALGPLTAATRSPDPEIRRRAAALLTALETGQFARPSFVNLHADRLPPAVVVAELARQTGYPVEYSSADDAVKEVTLHRGRLPFWAAVDAVREAANLQMDVQGDGQIVLSPGDLTDPFVSYAGPFRLTADDISAGHRRQLAGVPRRQPLPAGPDLLSVSFTLRAEPRTTVVWVGPPVVHAADDDRGVSLKPDADERTSYSPADIGQRGLSHRFDLDTLRRWQRGGTTLRTLRGVVPVAILAGTTPDVIVDDLGAAVGRTVRGRRHALAVESVTAKLGLCTVEVTATPTAGPPADGWQAGLPNRFELAGAGGAVWPFYDIDGLSSDGRAVRCKVRFKPPTPDAKPARLTLVEWRTVTRDVPFEFRDLPLP